MKCQICKNRQATIHLTEINDGIRSEMHICEQCAVEQGIAVKSQIPLNELLSNLLASQPDEEFAEGLETKESICPHCGFTLADLRKEAVLGCPYDYEFFKDSLLPIIERAQGGRSTHCGKIPSKTSEESKKKTQLMNFRQRLKASVSAEDYEKAAELRDKISELERSN